MKKELLEQLRKMEEAGLIKDRTLIAKVDACNEVFLDAFLSSLRKSADAPTAETTEAPAEASTEEKK